MLQFLLLIIPILIYIILAAVLVFHLKKYSLAGDVTKKMTKIFLTVSAILIVAAIFAFFSIDWKNFEIEELFQNFFFEPAPYNYY